MEIAHACLMNGHHTKRTEMARQVNKWIHLFILLEFSWAHAEYLLDSSWPFSEMPSGPFSSVVPQRHDFMTWWHHFWTFTRTIQLTNPFQKIKTLFVHWSHLWPQFPFTKKIRSLATFGEHWKRKPATTLAVCRNKWAPSLWTQSWTWRKATYTKY